MASKGRGKAARHEDMVSDAIMKERIKSLEAEVCTLKDRLDSLRRAKNTTIVKGGVVKSARSGSSHGNSGSHSNVTCDKCSCDEKMAELTRSHEQERRLHEQEVARLQQQLQTLQDHHNDKDDRSQTLTAENKQLTDDVDVLRTKVKELQDQLDGVVVANAQLASCNHLLRTKCDQLLEQLSVKEAKWSQREEELQLQLRQQWGERYQEWISKAEKKMEELQSINKMLQTMLKTTQAHEELQ